MVDRHTRLRMRLMPGGLLIALCLGVVGIGGQIPPSVRAPAPPPLSPQELQAQCMDLQEAVNLLTKDPVWLRQPYSAREVRDLEKMMKSIGCISGLEGTWQITGTPFRPDDFPGYSENVTMVAQKVDQDTGFADSEKWFGPVRPSPMTCRGANVFYNGTMTFASPPPSWGSLRVAKFSACGNSADSRGLVSGRFGAVQSDGSVSTKVGGSFIVGPTGPGEMGGATIGTPGPSVNWLLKKVG